MDTFYYFSIRKLIFIRGAPCPILYCWVRRKAKAINVIYTCWGNIHRVEGVNLGITWIIVACTFSRTRVMCPWISNFFFFFFTFVWQSWRLGSSSQSKYFHGLSKLWGNWKGTLSSRNEEFLPIAANYHNPQVTCTSTVADSGILMDG